MFESKAGFTPTLYNGLTVSFVTEPLQKACVNTFYCCNRSNCNVTVEPTREVVYLETLYLITV